MVEKILTGLNEPQRQAVEQTEGPVLILAGAGSGKTRTLTARIAYLIEQQNIDPTRILAVTFTNKAAGEMADRVSRLLGWAGHDYSLPWLGTFHSIGVKVLRRELNDSKLPFTNSFTIYDAGDQLSLIKQIMRDRQIDTKQFNPKSIKGLIEGAKNELLTPKEYSRYVDGHFQELAAEIYAEYQLRLVSANALDFDDLIMRTLQLFAEHPAILQKYQRYWQYILVDEYQDTNKGQYQLIKQLAALHKNIFVVGDDWQAIYAFRGADFRNILNFEQDYPDAKVIKLEENYRSTQTILDAAHAIITKNNQRSDKKLFTNGQTGEKIKVVECLNDFAEGEYVINESLKLVRTGVVESLDDVVILYRTNAQSRILEESMLRVSVPYRIVGSLKFYDRKEVKDILAYLKLIDNPADMVSFERIVNVPPRRVGKKTLLQYRQSLNDPKINTPPPVAEFWQLMDKIKAKAAGKAPAEIIEIAAEVSGYKDYLLDGSVEGETRWENVQELQGAAAGQDDLGHFLEQVALVQETDKVRSEANRRSGAGKGALTLMTLHAVKGLEFKAVFIVGTEEGVLPHSRSLMDPPEMEEERRLCYVGMTRPQKRLYLLYALERRLFGSPTANPPSRFIDEVPGRLVDRTKW